MKKVWKRTLVLILAVLLALGAGFMLAGCDDESDPNGSGNSGQTENGTGSGNTGEENDPDSGNTGEENDPDSGNTGEENDPDSGNTGEENDPDSGNTGEESPSIGVQVTEEEWNALLGSPAAAEEEGMRFLGQSNFKVQFKVQFTELVGTGGGSMTSVSSGDTVHAYSEMSGNTETAAAEVYWQVKGEDAVTVYSYDGDTESWHKGDMAYSDFEYSSVQFFLTLSDLNDSLGVPGLNLDLYGTYMFNEETGTYMRTIESTVGNGDVSYTISGSASVSFGSGEVLSIAVELLATSSFSENVTIKYDFTAGGQSVTIPDEVLAAEEVGAGVTDPEAPGESTDPTDPEAPGEPTDPTDPVDPTVPTDPTDPTDPELPGEPTDPTDPVDPTVPTDPTDPTDPELPGEPTDPTDPTVPTDPADPS